jgi:hypothetical protein
MIRDARLVCTFKFPPLVVNHFPCKTSSVQRSPDRGFTEHTHLPKLPGWNWLRRLGFSQYNGGVAGLQVRPTLLSRLLPLTTNVPSPVCLVYAKPPVKLRLGVNRKLPCSVA